MESTSWINQDLLKLSVAQWMDALQDPSIFHNEALQMVCFVYRQIQHQSTASDIAGAFSTPSRKIHPNKICAINRKVARALYRKYNVQPPLNSHGQHRYWNIVFDGNSSTPLDSRRYFFWRLRPNLVAAIGQLNLIM